jgi:tRNA modification GTPase
VTATVASCLTPPGTAALATLAVSGPDAWQVVRDHFRPVGSAVGLPEGSEPGRVWFGRFGTPPGDEAVLTLRRLTPVPWVELHVHGGREVVNWALDELRACGVASAAWHDFLRTVGEPSLRAAASVALSQASTARTAGILLDQYHGAFERAVAAVRHALDCGNPAGALAGLDQLARFGTMGRHLTAPWRVVVAGAPNAGKSSLVNALAGYHRSVVTATPGTTRDVVTTALAVEGWPVELTDTAGLRSGADDLEAAGIRQARAVLGGADLCLWVLDGSTEPVWPDESATGVMTVANKSDLPAAWDHGRADVPGVSALTRRGLPELCRRVAARLVPAIPPPGAGVPFTPELAGQVEAARAAVAAGGCDKANEILRALTKGIP